MFSNVHKQLFTQNKLPKGRYLMRDYIYNALYHPKYGYFNKYSKIVTPRINMAEVSDNEQFNLLLKQSYQKEAVKTFEMNKNDVFKQLPSLNTNLWHTPSELFSSIYGQIMANYVIEQYQNKADNKSCTILEVGAGNGTLMEDLLDFIKIHKPKIYKKLSYKIVDITKFNLVTKHKNVVVVNDSILNLRQSSNEFHIILLNEVLDNFAFDCVRYNKNEPLQGYINYDPDADLPNLVYTEEYSKLSDSHIMKLTKLLPTQPSGFELLKSRMPFMNNLTMPYFIPTQINYLLKVIKTLLPNHSILISDFDTLEDTIPGVNAPRIHASVDKQTVVVPTICVEPGPFDIFFPIDMEQIKLLYSKTDEYFSVSSRIAQPYFSYSADVVIEDFKPVEAKKHFEVYSHSKFCRKYLENCTAPYRLKDGTSPLLEYYKNFKVLTIQ
eukprot:NODE_305_length_11349_cov_0.358222.p3 type:complete len:438 gc:universal NODE_305_length_11349_cov_0.358222:180-1493(+)